MIIAYPKDKTLQPQEITSDNLSVLESALWVDLLCPTKAEEIFLESYLSFKIPSREAMQEIELSSRLYKDQGALFMTATMIAQSDSPEPKLDAVTCILTKSQLITLRYIEPQAFTLFSLRLKKLDSSELLPEDFFVEFLDVAVDRLADILEFVGRRLDESSQVVFRGKSSIQESSSKLDYQTLLQEVGLKGDLNTKARESLMTFNRLIAFFTQMINTSSHQSLHSRLIALSKDINSLSDHAGFISNKVNFLLDAILGLVNIEQNNTIKMFSVAAVIFLPPTLIASIYGMNFRFIPELSWYFGYPFAIFLIIMAAWLPYKYFKHRKWL